MTRRIFAELAGKAEVTPVCWNKVGNFYHRLGVRELEYLKTPFRRYKRPMSRPELFDENVGEFRRYFTGKSIDMMSSLQDRGVFLVPEMFSDRRVEELPELIRRTGARSVAIFHDAAGLRLSLLGRGRAERFRKYMESLAAFDLVVCVSNESRADLVQFWKRHEIRPRGETAVAGWPVEFDESERSGTPTDQSVILCVSSFTPRKNHLHLFDAAKQLWDNGLRFELELLGSSTGNWGVKVAFEVRRLQALGRPIRWLRHVDDRALHQAYRECLFTVYPSLMEGFGLPILESLWHGKPCMCGNNGALGEVASGGGSLFIDQNSTDSIAHGIRRLLSDQELYVRLKSEARARPFSSWPNYIEQLLERLRTSPRQLAPTEG